MVTAFSVPGVQLQRYGLSAYGVDGRFVQGSAALTPIVASIQSPTPAQVMRMPEGLRTEDTVVVYTATPLLTGPKADRIVYGGQTYEVRSIFDWAANGDYVEALCVKVVTK